MTPAPASSRVDSAHDDIGDYERDTIRHKTKRLVGHYGITAADLPDLEQDIATQLVIVMPRYDATKGARSTYISVIVDRQVARIVRSRTTARRDYRRVTSLGGSSDEAPSVRLTINLVDDRPERELRQLELRMDLENLVERLPIHLREVCRRLPSQAPSRIAREMHMSRRRLAQRIAELRQFFINAGVTG